MKLKENEGASQREKCQRGRGYKAERGLLEDTVNRSQDRRDSTLRNLREINRRGTWKRSRKSRSLDNKNEA